MNDKFNPIRNPMTVIALFVGLTEAGMGVGLANADKSVQPLLVSFMAAFAGITAIAFFVVLLARPQNFYGPADFRDETNYMALNTRLDKTDRLVAVIQQQIEATPLMQYSRLPEAGIRLFLGAYHHLAVGGEVQAPTLIWANLLKEDFSEGELSLALTELERFGWLSTASQPFQRTETGEKAHQSIRQFAYGRLM